MAVGSESGSRVPGRSTSAWTATLHLAAVPSALSVEEQPCDLHGPREHERLYDKTAIVLAARVDAGKDELIPLLKTGGACENERWTVTIAPPGKARRGKLFIAPPAEGRKGEVSLAAKYDNTTKRKTCEREAAECL